MVWALAAVRRHRESIGLWLMALVFATACVFLGRWQLHRYQDKHDKAELVSRNYDAPPVPLRRLLPSPTAPFAASLQWRQVRAQGTYEPADTLLVRNRPHRGQGAQGVYGYEVLVPLRLDDGAVLLVDRGWLPNGTRGNDPGAAPDAVPPPPRGRVQVLARLKPTEPAREQRLPPGQVASIAVRQIGAHLRLPVYPAYAVLTRESPSVTPAPALLDPPVTSGNEGINASYAVQWLLFALLGLGFPIWVRRRRRDDARQLGDDARQRGDDVAPPRPRRPRIWDADDE